MAQATLSTGLARSHLVHVLHREVPFMAQASLSAGSRPHLLLVAIASLCGFGLTYNFANI